MSILLRRGVISSSANPTYAASTAVIDSTSKYYSFSGPADISGDMTLNIWVKFDTLPDIARLINMGNASGNSYRAPRLSVQSDGTVEGLAYVAIGNASGFSLVESSSGAVSTGSWNMITYRLDTTANTLKVFVNASEVGSISSTNENPGTTGDFEIGRLSDSGSGELDGTVGFAGYWDTSLSTSQLSDLYNGGDALCYDVLESKSSGITTNLVNYWHMADFTGHTTDEETDQHGSSNLTNNGTIGYTGSGLDVEC